MSSISEAEGAKAYETLLALLQDEGKALQAYRMMALAADVSDPLPSYCSRIAGRLPFSEDMLLAKWREVRDAFEADRVVSSVLSEESPLFPRMEGACFPFIYAAGNTSLLLGRIAVFLGSPQPSIQAKSDTLDAVAEFISQGGTVLAPMEPGIPAFALQLALKLGGAGSLILGGMLLGAQSTTQTSLLPILGPAWMATGVSDINAAAASAHLAAAGQGLPPADLNTFVIAGLVSSLLQKQVNPMRSMILTVPYCLLLAFFGLVFLFV